jgi:hypothetical protein
VYFPYLASSTLSFRYYILFRVMIMEILLTAVEERLGFLKTRVGLLNFEGSYYGITERRHRSDGFR